MDYHSLPRKQLQSLCKKHGLPANASNAQMADSLAHLIPRPVSPPEKVPAKEDVRRNGKQEAQSGKSNDEESMAAAVRQTRARGGGGLTKSTRNLNKDEIWVHAEPPHQQGSSACAEEIDDDDKAIKNDQEVTVKQSRVVKRRGGCAEIEDGDRILNCVKIQEAVKRGTRGQGKLGSKAKVFIISDGEGENYDTEGRISGKEGQISDKASAGRSGEVSSKRPTRDHNCDCRKMETLDPPAQRRTFLRGGGGVEGTQIELIHVTPISDESKHSADKLDAMISSIKGSDTNSISISENEGDIEDNCETASRKTNANRRRKSVRGGGEVSEKENAVALALTVHRGVRIGAAEVKENVAPSALTVHTGVRVGAAKVKKTVQFAIDLEEQASAVDCAVVANTTVGESLSLLLSTVVPAIDIDEVAKVELPQTRRGRRASLAPNQVASRSKSVATLEMREDANKGLNESASSNSAFLSAVSNEEASNTKLPSLYMDEKSINGADTSREEAAAAADKAEVVELSQTRRGRRASVAPNRALPSNKSSMASEIRGDPTESLDESASSNPTSVSAVSKEEVTSISDLPSSYVDERVINRADASREAVAAADKAEVVELSRTRRGRRASFAPNRAASSNKSSTALEARRDPTESLEPASSKSASVSAVSKEVASNSDLPSLYVNEKLINRADTNREAVAAAEKVEVVVGDEEEVEIPQTRRGQRFTLGQNRSASNTKSSVTSKIRGGQNKVLDKYASSNPTSISAVCKEEASNSKPPPLSVDEKAINGADTSRQAADKAEIVLVRDEEEVEFPQTRRGRKSSCVQNRAASSSYSAATLETRGDPNKGLDKSASSSPNSFSAVSKEEASNRIHLSYVDDKAINEAVTNREAVVAADKADVVVVGDEEEVELPQTRRGRRPALQKNRAACNSKSAAAMEMSGNPQKDLGNAPLKDNSASASSIPTCVSTVSREETSNRVPPSYVDDKAINEAVTSRESEVKEDEAEVVVVGDEEEVERPQTRRGRRPALQKNRAACSSKSAAAMERSGNPQKGLGNAPSKDNSASASSIPTSVSTVSKEETSSRVPPSYVDDKVINEAVTSRESEVKEDEAEVVVVGDEEKVERPQTRRGRRPALQKNRAACSSKSAAAMEMSGNPQKGLGNAPSKDNSASASSIPTSVSTVSKEETSNRVPPSYVDDKVINEAVTSRESEVKEDEAEVVVVGDEEEVERPQTRRGRRPALKKNQAVCSSKSSAALEMSGNPHKGLGNAPLKDSSASTASSSPISVSAASKEEVSNRDPPSYVDGIETNEAVTSREAVVTEDKADIVIVGDEEEVERPQTRRGRKPALKKNQAACSSKSSTALEMIGIPHKGFRNAPSWKDNSASATNFSFVFESSLKPDEKAFKRADLDPTVVMDMGGALQKGSDEAPSWDLGFEEDRLVATKVEEGKDIADPEVVEPCGGIIIDEGLQMANDVGDESNHPAEGEEEAMAVFFSNPEIYPKEAEDSSIEHSIHTSMEVISCVGDEKHGEEGSIHLVCSDLLEVHDCPRPSWELSAAFTVPETFSKSDLSPALVFGFNNVHMQSATGELLCEGCGHSSESCEEKSLLSSVPETHLKETEDCPKEILTASPTGSSNEYAKSEGSLYWEKLETVQEIVLSNDDNEKAAAITASSSNQLQNVRSYDFLQQEKIDICTSTSSDPLEEIDGDSVHLGEEDEGNVEGDEAGKVGRYSQEFRGTEGNEFGDTEITLSSEQLPISEEIYETAPLMELSLSAFQPLVYSEEASGLIIQVEEEDDVLETQISVEVEEGNNVANLIETETSIEVEETNLANLMESEEANLLVAVNQLSENDEFEIHAKNDVANAIPTLSHQIEVDHGVEEEEEEEESKESECRNEEAKTDAEDSLRGEESPAVEAIDPMIMEDKYSVAAVAKSPAVEEFGRTCVDSDLLLAEEDRSCLSLIVDELSKFYIATPCKNSESSNVGNIVEFLSDTPGVAKLDKERGFLVLTECEQNFDHPAEHSVVLGSTSTSSQEEAENEICEQSRQGEGIIIEFVTKKELSECPNLIEKHRETASEENFPAEEEKGLSESVDRKDCNSGMEVELRPLCVMEKSAKKEAENEICEQSRHGEEFSTEFVNKKGLSECPNLLEKHREKASEEIFPAEEEKGLSESVDRKDCNSGMEVELRPLCGMEKSTKKIDYTALSLRKLRLLCKQKGRFPPSAPATTSIMPPLLSSLSFSIPAQMIADSANMESEGNTESTDQKPSTIVASGQVPPASIDGTSKKTIPLANKAASEFSAKKTPTSISKRTPLKTLPSNMVQRPLSMNLPTSFQTGGSSPYLARQMPSIRFLDSL